MPTELDENKLKVLNVFRLLGQASKAEVARRIDLTHPAVSEIVKRLCDAGYLKQEPRKRQGQRGQPATLYSLSDNNVFIGIHVGRRRIEFVGLDLDGNRLSSLQLDFGYMQRAELEAQCQPALNRFLARKAIRERQLIGIGISTPYFWEGWPSTPQTGEKGWNKDIVKSLFRFPQDVAVFVENDGSSAALGELTFGSGATHPDFLYVYIGTYIGGGLIIDGTLKTGVNGNSAALGPFPVAHSTLQESACRSRPFEPLLDRASIHTLREHAGRAGADPDLAAWHDTGTPEALDYLNEWAEDCSAALAQCFIAVWSLIDVDAIILDGALPRDLLERIIAATDERIKDYAVEYIIPSKIKLGQLGSTAQSIGAACLPVLRFLGPPPIDADASTGVTDETS